MLIADNSEEIPWLKLLNRIPEVLCCLSLKYVAVNLVLSFLASLMGTKSIFTCFKDQETDRVGWKTVDAAFLTQQANTVGKMGAFRSLFVGY